MKEGNNSNSLEVASVPLNVLAEAGNAKAVVSFDAPVNNGGSAITSYVVTSNPGGVSASGASSPITVSGLTNVTSYTFMVVAVNGVGNSSAQRSIKRSCSCNKSRA